MISSTREDLMHYRKCASKLIDKLADEFQGQLSIADVSMEHNPQSGEHEEPAEVSAAWVERADWVVVIVGWNYGDDSDAQQLSSYTQQEYACALRLERKIFAFLTGEPGSENEYRVGPNESSDLKDWRGIQNDQLRERLRLFREQLGRYHVEFFKNLEHFEERLEKTLRNAIREQLEERTRYQLHRVQRGGALAILSSKSSRS
jgi:hypothetical protein